MSAPLESVRAAVAAGRLPDPEVRAALAETTDPAVLRRAGRLLAGLAPPGSPRVRVAVSSTCTVGAFEQMLRASLFAAGAVPDLVLGEHGALEMDLVTGRFIGSDPPRFVVALVDESYFVPADWSAAGEDDLAEHMRSRMAAFRAAVASAAERTPATVVLHTIPLPEEIRDVLVSWRARTRLTRQWYELNGEILALAEEHDRVETVDLAGLLASAPYAARDDRLHRYGDMPYTDGALLLLAQQVRRIVQAKMGSSRKVLALDLDDTLWGGVLGEVGASGVQLGGLYPGNCYVALQRTARRLREQGVILVLTSKNDHELVESALTSHPEMVLGPDAFAVRAVNWSSKADNLRRIATSLALPVASFVFMDDAEFERAEVSARLPEVAMVSAAGDPAHLVRSLLRPGWFDVVALTDTDRQRTDLYRARAERADLAAGFDTREDYLHSLGIELDISPVTAFTVPRVAQIASRTNQFNLTGLRFDERETAELSGSPEHLVASISVSDRFGSEGIVGAIWVARDQRLWRVLNLALSCRVLGRGIEFAIAGWLARTAGASGADAVSGRFVPSTRNGVAASFWAEAGFADTGDGEFVLDLRGPLSDIPAWIKVHERNEV